MLILPRSLGHCQWSIRVIACEWTRQCELCEIDLPLMSIVLPSPALDSSPIDAFIIGNRAREHFEKIIQSDSITPRYIAQLSKLFSTLPYFDASSFFPSLSSSR